MKEERRGIGTDDPWAAEGKGFGLTILLVCLVIGWDILCLLLFVVYCLLACLLLRRSGTVEMCVWGRASERVD